MIIQSFKLPRTFKDLTEQGVELPQGAQIMRVDANAEGIRIVAMFAPDAQLVRRNLHCFDLGCDIPDDYLPRLQLLGVYQVFGLLERMYGFGADRSFALFIEREDSFWSGNPADIMFELLRDNPNVDLPRLQRWREDARAYWNEPVPAGYDAPTHAEEDDRDA